MHEASDERSQERESVSGVCALRKGDAAAALCRGDGVIGARVVVP